MLKPIVLSLLLVSCSGPIQHCPPKTAQTALDCKEQVAKGLKTKDQCYSEIEASCP